MAKKKEEIIEPKHSVAELTTSFSNGEVNELREKLNELIKATK